MLPEKTSSQQLSPYFNTHLHKSTVLEVVTFNLLHQRRWLQVIPFFPYLAYLNFLFQMKDEFEAVSEFSMCLV